jgi:hypothetical protein
MLGVSLLFALFGCSSAEVTTSSSAVPASTVADTPTTSSPTASEGAASSNVSGTAISTRITSSGGTASSNLAPSRGWARESVHRIVWPTPPGLTAETTGALTVDYSLDEGASWSAVPAEQYDALARQLLFVVPATGGTTVRIRVVEAGQVTETASFPLIASQRHGYRFTKVTEKAPFGPRDGTGGLVYHGRLYAIGGWNPVLYPKTTTVNDVWSSADGVDWRLEKPNTFVDPATFDPASDWPARHFAGYVVHDDKMFIVGGDPNQGVYQTDVYSSTDGKSWVRETADWGISPTRTLHHVTEHLGKIWVLGGQSFTDFGGSGVSAGGHSDVHVSLDGRSFTKVQTQGEIWQPRGIIGNHAVMGGRMWIVDGGLYPDPLFPYGVEYGDTWSSADGVTWQREAEDPPFSARYYHSLATFDGRLWVMGGFNSSGNLADNWYTADGSNWYPATTPGLVGRHAGTVWVLDDTTMFWGSGNAIYDDGITESWLADIWKIQVLP